MDNNLDNLPKTTGEPLPQPTQTQAQPKAEPVFQPDAKPFSTPVPPLPQNPQPPYQQAPQAPQQAYYPQGYVTPAQYAVVESPVVKAAKELASHFNGTLMLTLSFVFSIALVDLVLRGGQFNLGVGFGIPIIVALGWLLFLPMIIEKRKALPRQVFISLIPTGILALCFGYFSSTPVKAISVPVLLVVIILQTAQISGISNANLFSMRNAGISLRTVFALPFECFGPAYSSMNGKREKGKGLNAGSKVLVAALFSLPAVIFLIWIFAKSDAIFESYVQSFLSLIRIDATGIFLDVFFGGLIALFIFPLVFALKSGFKLEIKTGKGSKGIDWVYVASFLGICALVYLSYVAVQFTYFFDAALPASHSSNINYSEYANRGFGELCFIIALTFAVVMTAVHLTRKNEKGEIHPIVRIVLSVLSASALIFVASAFFRVYLYTQTYGLTRSRVMGCWFIVTLGLCVLGLIAKIWVKNLNIAVIIGTVVVLMTIVLNLMNVDYNIAKYNVARYNQTGKLDISYLSELSPDMIPALKGLIGTPKEKDALALMRLAYRDLEDKRVGSWSVQQLRARDMIIKYKADELGVEESFSRIHGYSYEYYYD